LKSELQILQNQTKSSNYKGNERKKEVSHKKYFVEGKKRRENEEKQRNRTYFGENIK
jgi:hypothetical protein